MVLIPRSLKLLEGHQGEEAVIYVAYFKINCAMGVERRDKGSALFHIISVCVLTALKVVYSNTHLSHLV